MPFISKDWRSPGELWVKTQEGWEKSKVLENCKMLKQKSGSVDTENKESDSTLQPHCHITIKCTREIAGFNELDEVFKRLDFRNAVRDVRRFNYICALLDLLIGQQMTGVSGCTQRVLLAMLEEVATYATTTQHNPRTLRRLLLKLKALSQAEQNACWGAPLGSKLLWNQHSLTIQRIQMNAGNFQVRETESRPQFLQLPEECIREVILRLSDHRDIVSAAEVNELAAIANEARVWRELVKFHFSQQQIDLVLAQNKKTSKTDWKDIYHSLKRTYGVNEERQYAEMLSLCRYCCCLFWRSSGHPCIADQCPEFKARLQEAGGKIPSTPVPPQAFLKFFSL